MALNQSLNLELSNRESSNREVSSPIADAAGAPREWLTVEQSADYLQLSQSSIRSYIRQGRLDARRIAGKRKVLIHRSELLKLLEPARLPVLMTVPGEEPAS